MTPADFHLFVFTFLNSPLPHSTKVVCVRSIEVSRSDSMSLPRLGVKDWRFCFEISLFLVPLALGKVMMLYEQPYGEDYMVTTTTTKIESSIRSHISELRSGFWAPRTAALADFAAITRDTEPETPT